MAVLRAHHYFFALLPDPVTARRIRAWIERKRGPDGLLSTERLHLTLAITPPFSAHQPALVDALLRAGATVSACPFALVLEQLSTGGRSFALRPRHSVPALRELQGQIVRAMAGQGAARRSGSFSPHVTLGYRQGLPSTEPVRDLGWRVSEFVLVHSFVGLTLHEVLARWPLTGAPEEQLSLFAS